MASYILLSDFPPGYTEGSILSDDDVDTAALIAQGASLIPWTGSSNQLLALQGYNAQKRVQGERSTNLVSYMAAFLGLPAEATDRLSVGPAGSGFPYTTIQSAINAASAGDQVTVYPGTYTENITSKAGVSVKGPNPSSLAALLVGPATVVGSLTCSHTSGVFAWSGIDVKPATGVALTASGAAGTTVVTDSQIAGAGGVAVTAAHVLYGSSVYIQSDSAANALAQAAGTVNLWDSVLEMTTATNVAVATSATAASTTLLRARVTGSITHAAGDMVVRVANTLSGATAAVTHSSAGTLRLSQMGISTTAATAIAGAGAGNLFVGPISWESTGTGFAGTLTLVPDQMPSVYVAGSGLFAAAGATQTPDTLLDLQSTTAAFKVMVMTEAERDAIATPAEGMIVATSDSNELNYYNGSAWTTVTVT